MIRTIQLAGLVATVALMGACQNSADGNVALEASAASAPADRAQPAGGEEAVAESSSGISGIINHRSIGATKEFLERTLGQSTYETPQVATYQAHGCEVMLSLASGAVAEVAVRLQPGCQFNASQFALGDSGSTVIDGSITFSQFEELFGEAKYTAPCLSMCGNAYDPYMDAVIQGSRANGVIDVAAHVVFVSDEAIEASFAWSDQLESIAGDDYVDFTKFNCERTHDDIPRGTFASVAVDRFVFGRDLGTWNCEEW